MAHQLFTVQDRFTVSGVGAALIGLTQAQCGEVGKGEIIDLRRPDGSSIRAVVVGVEFPSSVIWTTESATTRRYALIVSASADDVPVGTDVWSVD